MSKRYRGSKKGKNNKKQKTHGRQTITELADWVEVNRNRHARNENLQEKSHRKPRVIFKTATYKDMESITEEIFGGRYYCIGDTEVNGIIHSD
jgi:hypothetical protein